MITASTIQELSQQLATASQKAFLVNPECVKVEFRHYKVKGSKGNFYDVYLGINEDKQYFVACTCRAGLEHKNCYHAACALEAHLKEMFEQREVVKDSDSPYFSGGTDRYNNKRDKLGV